MKETSPGPRREVIMMTPRLTELSIARTTSMMEKNPKSQQSATKTTPRARLPGAKSDNKVQDFLVRTPKRVPQMNCSGNKVTDFLVRMKNQCLDA